MPVGGEIFRTCPDRSWGPPSLLYNGYRVFLGGKEQPGRDADPSPSSSAVVSHRSGKRQPKTYVKPEAAITVFELLMMGGVSPETCWAIKKQWNNKFYYTVASCWFFLWDFRTDVKQVQKPRSCQLPTTQAYIKISRIQYNFIPSIWLFISNIYPQVNIF
jgi:hypothetical protein